MHSNDTFARRGALVRAPSATPIAAPVAHSAANESEAAPRRGAAYQRLRDDAAWFCATLGHMLTAGTAHDRPWLDDHRAQTALQGRMREVEAAAQDFGTALIAQTAAEAAYACGVHDGESIRVTLVTLCDQLGVLSDADVSGDAGSTYWGERTAVFAAM